MRPRKNSIPNESDFPEVFSMCMKFKTNKHSNVENSAKMKIGAKCLYSDVLNIELRLAKLMNYCTDIRYTVHHKAGNINDILKKIK